MSDNPIQLRLKALLKGKGIGQHMGKCLTSEELTELSDLFAHPDAHLTTKATLLTALLMLPPTAEEKAWLDHLSHHFSEILPYDLQFMITRDVPKSHALFSLACRVLNHETFSYEEMLTGISEVLDPTCPEFVKAIFLEGLRLKRESLEENKACLDCFYDAMPHAQTRLPLLIDLANPYDGFNRSPNLSLFVAVILGAMGFPTLVHGTETVAPKYGVTPYALLDLAQKNPLKSVEEVQQALETPTIGWGYLDQSIYFPPLHALQTLRKNMVKRPLLATMEKFLTPILAESTYLVTGYTHPPYRAMTEHILLQHPALTDFMIVRGVEGSCTLPIDRRTPLVTRQLTAEQNTFISPESVDMLKYEQLPEHETISDLLESGIKILSGEDSPLASWVQYNVLGIIHTFRLMPLSQARQTLTELLLSGRALSHWLYY